MIEQLRCIVFDVDDTLYLERDYARSGFEAVGEFLAQEYELQGFSDRAWELFEQGARGTIFDQVLSALGVEVSPARIRELVEVYRAHRPEIELLDDARHCLNALSARYRLAALTGGPIASQRAKVSALGLEQWCDPIIYAGQWGREFDKPHRRAFEELERRSGFSGSQCIYISDNPAKDFAAPKALGWHIARVRRPGGIYEALEADAGMELEEFTGLGEWLREFDFKAH